MPLKIGDQRMVAFAVAVDPASGFCEVVRVERRRYWTVHRSAWAGQRRNRRQRRSGL